MKLIILGLNKRYGITKRFIYGHRYSLHKDIVWRQMLVLLKP